MCILFYNPECSCPFQARPAHTHTVTFTLIPVSCKIQPHSSYWWPLEPLGVKGFAQGHDNRGNEAGVFSKMPVLTSTQITTRVILNPCSWRITRHVVMVDDASFVIIIIKIHIHICICILLHFLLYFLLHYICICFCKSPSGEEHCKLWFVALFCSVNILCIFLCLH